MKFFLGLALGALAMWGIAVTESRADELETFQKQAIAPVVQLARNCSGTVIEAGAPSQTYILTANHCVDEEASGDSQRGFVTIDDKVRGKLIGTSEYVYDVVVRDVQADLSVIKLRKEGLFLPAATIAQEDPREGETVWTIGYPLGLTKTVTEGHMGEYESLDNNLANDKFGDARILYRATPAIYGGNSGGGFFMKRGDKYLLVGVADAGFRSFFVAGYYVPQDAINSIVTRALKAQGAAVIEQRKMAD